MLEATEPGAEQALKRLPLAETKELVLQQGPALTQIALEMSKHSKLTGWLKEAESQLIASQDDFTTRLGVKAVQIAHERNGTAVDPDDVEKAWKNVFPSEPAPDSDGWKTVWLALAAMFGGGAIATAVAIGLVPDHIPNIYLWWIAVIVQLLACLVFFVLGVPKTRSKTAV